ncbi:MAG: ORF6N domain-containing protein [Nitrospinae bacterium]|nr:ORF6N domain-containing protein [Nitrospinota bacterium]
MEIAIQQEVIEGKIYMICGHKVMLSTDLAELYEVEPRVLVQAVKRNIDRFPSDFMFQLNEVEFENLKSQIVTSSWGGLRRANPQLMAPPEPKKRKIGFTREKGNE